MRFSALLFSFVTILLGLTQVAALQPVIVRDSESDHRRDESDDHRDGEEIGRSGWFSTLYQITFLPPLAGAAIQEISESIPKIEETLKGAVNRIITSAGAILPPQAGAAIQEISIPKIEETLKGAVNRIITSAGAIINTLQNIDIKEFQDRLEFELDRVFKELENEFSEPLPEDKTEKYKQQETMITQAVEKIEDAVVHVCSNWKIPEDTVRADFDKVKPHLNHALLIIANLANNHPDLLWFLCSSVIFAMIPEGFILSPILRFFGFGPLGPVKGSIAARAQSFFYGGNVPKGSFFAWLQNAGMKMGVAMLKLFK